ncbi:MAG TPA: M2 family metallopeptidase [Gemmatimonadales bacterium]|nr:M2 family metallopeptidase [Gemmatimonadales bacterium]
MRRRSLLLLLLLLPFPLAAAWSQERPATAADAQRYMAGVERALDSLSIESSRAQWVAANFITEDTEALSAAAQLAYNLAVRRFAADARRFERLDLPADLRRKFRLLKLSVPAPSPADPAGAAELARLTTSMEGDYGKGSWCRPARSGGEECLQIDDIERILGESREPEELRAAWEGWHRVGAPMRQRYTRFVELANEGARGLGFADAGEMWRSGYDMPPAEFTRETERLWTQLRPLYLSLHAYVRARLVERYGPDVVPPHGLIPAHLLGNLWAQDWTTLLPLLVPDTADLAVLDVTKLLEAKKVDATAMVRYGEGFYTSLGLEPLPETFWKRSLIVKPRDREVVCHASAWNIDNERDVRIKMCTEPTATDFVTVHHELGHNYYSLAYNRQPYLFQGGANDGFHEAIGDAVALAITPEYLRKVGLLETVPSAAKDTLLLLTRALDKVVFLPWASLVDRWRWDVFSGRTPPDRYNETWWALKGRYQGVAPPAPRSERDFDPGAKYHVAGNTPYARYFLAYVLEFQFYRAMCREAGHTGPLYRCSFFGSKEAGRKLQTMLAAGASRPWQETLRRMTGESGLDAAALLEYFAPLKACLDRRNEGKAVGWPEGGKAPSAR